MSIWSPTYQQSVFKRCCSDKHFSEFYLQDGGKYLLAQIRNKMTSLSRYLFLASAKYNLFGWVESGCEKPKFYFRFRYCSETWARETTNIIQTQ